MARLQGKVAVVIGGATGIGAATVRRLAGEGAAVYLGDTNLEGAQALAASIVKAAGVVEAALVDQSQEASMQAAMEAAEDRFGAINCLFMNGADTRQETMGRDTDAVSIDLEVWDSILRTNLRGYLLGIRFAVPRMLSTGGGSIVCTSSEFSLTSDGSLPAYGVSKAAVNQLVRHVAARWGREGIRCNAIAPGIIQTETLLRLITPELNAHFLQSVCSPRLGLPEDIAAEVAHLFSDDAAFLNGQIISVNGGSLFK